MSSNKAHAIQFAIMPRDPKLPADIDLLSSVAILSFNPAKRIERLNRMDHIATLISETLVEAGR